MTVDKFLNEEGEETTELSSGAASALSMAAEELPRDSIWNFHVWNEVVHQALFYILYPRDQQANLLKKEGVHKSLQLRCFLFADGGCGS